MGAVKALLDYVDTVMAEMLASDPAMTAEEMESAIVELIDKINRCLR